MPGRPLPTPVERDVDERNAQLAQQDAAAFSGSLVDCAGGNITGALSVAGRTTVANVTLTGALNASASEGTNGQVLTSGGPGVNPSWQAGGGGSGGNITSTGAVGGEPGSPAAGDLYLPNNSPDIERYSGSAWTLWGPVYPFTRPVAAQFAFINQGGASLVDNTNSLCLLAPQNSGSHNARILKKAAPATPYTITVFIKATILSSSSDDRHGLVFRDSVSGKFSAFQSCGTANGTELRVTYYSSPTTPISNGVAFGFSGVPEWLQISDDGTNRIYRISVDGLNWSQYYTEVRTANLTADEVGWFCNPLGGNSVNVDVYTTLFSWKQT